MKTTPFLFAASAAALGLLTAQAGGGNDAVVTAVFSSVSNGYQRHKQPDGTFQREYYALANGKQAKGLYADPSIDQVAFPEIAQLVMKDLAKQNYAMAENAKSANLLLVVSWGTTVPWDDNGGGRAALDRTIGAMNAVTLTRHALALEKAAAAAGHPDLADNARGTAGALNAEAENDLIGQVLEQQMFNDMRMKANERNARLLGYTAEINRRDNASRLAGLGASYDDLIKDIEEERYYVVIFAYDFATATKKGERKLLWATRVSIRAQGNRFDDRLKTMLANASGYFGQYSDELIRQYHSGSVRMDDLQFIDDKPAASPAATTTKKK